VVEDVSNHTSGMKADAAVDFVLGELVSNRIVIGWPAGDTLTESGEYADWEVHRLTGGG